MPEPNNLREVSAKDIDKRASTSAFIELMKMGASKRGVHPLSPKIMPRTDHFHARQN